MTFLSSVPYLFNLIPILSLLLIGVLYFKVNTEIFLTDVEISLISNVGYFAFLNPIDLHSSTIIKML